MKKLLFLFVLQFLFEMSYSQCNGHVSLCSKNYDEVSYLTTHNAFNSDADGFLFPNQTYNISSQLNSGVRALMIDVYDYQGTPTAYHSFSLLGTIPLSFLFDDTYGNKATRGIFSFSIRFIADPNLSME